MKKSDIQDRLTAIDNRLNELPNICERENRQLTEAETREKNDLIAERSDLQRQLAEIETGEHRAYQPQTEKPFSLLGEIRNIVNGGRFEGQYADETRAMAEASKLEYGVDHQTILMKASMNPSMRSLNGILTAGDNYASNSKNGGLEMVSTDVLPIIEAIYNFTVLDKAGAMFYNGLMGNAKIPTMSEITFGFKAETAAADTVTPTMGKVELAPQRLTGTIWISKQLLRQTSEDLEARLRLSISKAIALALNKAVLANDTTPHNGLMYNASTVAKASVTYDTVLELAESLYNGNMMPSFVANPKAARILKQLARISGGNEAIMAGGLIDDAPTYITNSIAASASTSGALACADFSRLHVGTWGDLLDITVDTVTKAGSGQVGLILNYFCDYAWDTANGTAYAVKEITTV